MDREIRGHSGRARGRDDWERQGDEQNQEEQRQEEAIRERTAISAHVVYHAIVAEGEEELGRPTSALAYSGLAAGLSMGFSFLAEGYLRAHLPDANWTPLVAKLGYPMGFLIVILGRQQLFTENTLTPILPLLKYKRLATLWNIMRLWGAVFVANWVGTMLFALVLGHSGIIPEQERGTFLDLGREGLVAGFWGTVLRAVFAGWLIALLVWLLPFAETGRVAVIFLMTYLVSLGSFRHVVAGSVDVFYLVVKGEATWARYLFSFMLPTLLGNIAGGVALVAALNHAQVTSGVDEAE